MPRQRGNNITEVEDWLRKLEIWIEQEGLLSRQSVLIDMENFFRDVLNLMFGWSLGNANYLFGRNQKGIDLSDKANRIAVQVTATDSATKITNTLSKFIGSHDEDYDRLIMMYPKTTFSGNRKDFSPLLKGFDFDPKRDRMGFGQILLEAQEMEPHKQEELLNLLRRDLGPLDSAGEAAMDRTLEVLINIIRVMTNEPLDKLPEQEIRPDQEAKLKRLHEHADYLKMQYQENAGLHNSVKAARKAVGIDTVRAGRIQSFLKTRSLRALRECKNDAAAAFDQMVDYFLEQAASTHTGAEETAVRFFLATELTECNVFPNLDKTDS